MVYLSNPDMKCTGFLNGTFNITYGYASTGGLIDNIPTICGGFRFGFQPVQTCFAFGNPNMTMKMLVPRKDATSVLINSTTLWVIGGLNLELRGSKGAFLSSTELVSWTKPSPIKGPTLPSPLYASCSVKYNSTSIYIIGGIRKIPKSKNSDSIWIFDPSNNFFVRKGPSLQVGRRYHSCGILRSKGRSYVVVAGGQVTGGTITNSVEILDPMSNKGWMKGKPASCMVSKKLTYALHWKCGFPKQN